MNILSKDRKNELTISPGMNKHDDIEERVSSDEDSRSVTRALLGTHVDELADEDKLVDET